MADGSPVSSSPEEKQRHRRASIICSGRVELPDASLDCDILDISVGGAKIAIGKTLEPAAELVLQIGDLVALPGRVAWNREGQAGIEFSEDPGVIAVALPEILEGPAKEREQREHLRSTVLWSGEVACDGTITPCRILNVSPSGAKVRIERSFDPGTEASISCSRFGDVLVQVVWSKDGNMGLRFQESPRRILQFIGNFLPRSGLT